MTPDESDVHANLRRWVELGRALIPEPLPVGARVRATFAWPLCHVSAGTIQSPPLPVGDRGGYLVLLDTPITGMESTFAPWVSHDELELL